MAARKFNPAAHPRDRYGRFTKSRTVKATPKDKAAAKAVADGFNPQQPSRGERQAYLRKIAGSDSSTQAFADVTEANKALRADKDAPGAAALEQTMVALPDDVLLSRRVPLSAFGATDPQALVGMKVRDAGFAPTQLGTVRAVEGQVRMRIAAPAGTRAAINPDTGEVVLDRDTEMVVARVEANPAGGVDMYLTVLPKTSKLPTPKPDGVHPAKQGAKSDGPDLKGQPDGGDTVRADLMKLKVPELQAQMRERGLKPGRLRKSQLVDALVADETGDEATPAGEAPPVPERPYADRISAAVTGDAALESVPLSLTRADTHARAGSRKGLSVEARNALLDYQGNTYSIINGKLRGTPGPAQNHPFADEWIADLDKAMEASPLPGDVVAYRGVRNARRMFGDRLDADLTGMQWREDAYLSTSTSQDVTDGFVRGTDGVRMRLLVPAGVGAVQVSDRVDAAGHADEAEILLERGRTLRVVGDRGVDADGVRDLDVEVVPA